MEPYKFRGKSKETGEWVYGSLTLKTNSPRIANYNQAGYWVETEVVPESIRQYTTHKDKNGKELYAGHVIQYEFTESSCWGAPGNYTGHIRFNEGVFEVVHHRDPIRRFPDGTWTQLSEADDMKSFMSWAEEVVVIGDVDLEVSS